MPEIIVQMAVNETEKEKKLTQGELIRLLLWRLGEVAHTCNPSYMGGIGRRITV
jgi:hypothetical protein